MVPNDALYQNQWHLQSIGDIQTVWNDYNGQGVHVGAYDSGIEYTHPDLVQNYDASRHVVINGTVHDPRPQNNSVGTDIHHGTASAGLIGARGNNGIGVVGTGWGSSLTGVNILDTQSSAYIDTPGRVGFLSAIRQTKNFDLTSHSWAKKPEYYASQNLNDPTSLRADIDAYYADASAQGRGGLGTVIVQSAGNDFAEAQGDGLNVSRYTVTVAAARQDGFASSYSNNGACILLTAPGGEGGNSASIVTTDRTGATGKSPGDYMNNFAGTSASTPIVSGVVALMLQANPNLGWRDVQTILALSSTHTGSAIGASTLGTNEDGWTPGTGTWQIDAADNYNGGGMHFSVDYGYGMLDAYNAVRMAEAWTLFSPTAQTSANERSFSTGNLTFPANTVIPDGGYRDVSFNVSASMILEHADITLTFTHGDFKDLDIYAYSAEGSWALLHRGGDTLGPSDVSANGLSWTFGVDSLRGEATAGTWYIRFVDKASNGATGTVTKMKFDAYGTTPSADDVYHYTDEFADLSSQNGTRKTLNDTDGGDDWINAAAVKGACLVDLAAGGTTRIADTPITMGSGRIENVATGDGNDVITANAATNTLAGGRGGDTYRVDSAADRVIERAAQGSDTLISSATYVLAEGQSVESLLAADKTGIAPINLTGNALGNVVQGTNGVNVLNGGGGNDDLSGYASNDKLLGGIGNDSLSGLEGNDSLDGGTGNDRLSGWDGKDTIKGGTGNDRIQGGFGADMLTGGAGRDTFVYATLPTKPESGPGATSRDTITDFSHGTDKIDVSLIRAAKFKFLGEDDFTAQGGEVRYRHEGSKTVVEVNTDRDKAAEIAIVLKGHLDLTGGDFVL